MRIIDETEDDIRALIAADFGPTRRQRLSDEFIDWLHFKARSIPRVPRTIITSPEAAAHLAPYPAVDRIRTALRVGDGASQWLSNSVRAAKRDPKADMMFNDWQIVHFHLGSVFATPKAVRRTDNLLFAHITGTTATLIDVQPHGAWTMTALLEILRRANPAAGYEPKGVTGQRLTDDQYKNLRRNGGNSLIEIDGKALSPGMGIMSSGHALRITLYHDWFRRQLEAFKANVAADKVPDHLKPVIYAALGVPIRVGAWYDDQGLALIDKNRRGRVLLQMRPLE
jgi:hypothetical protein